MGTNTLETAYSNGQIIDASHVNELTAAIINQFVGRNTSGVPEAGKSLGTAAIPWGTIHAGSLVLNGAVVDTSEITSLANRIVSGKTRADSQQPDFVRADGSAATLTVQGASTNLTLSINTTAVTVSSDITKTALTLAPSSNNTCLVNDSNLTNDFYAGEDGTSIIIDTVGSEISALVGQYIALKTPTNEILYGFLKSATEITNVYRGFFFDDTGAPIVRGNLSNNDTLTLMNVGYVFVEDNGTTVDISYLQPVYSFEAPSGPATGQYWFDIPNQVWKRYSGTEFEIINRMLIGTVVLDDTAAIAQRSGDFTNSFKEFNNLELEIASSEIIESKEFSNRVNVYGTELVQDLTKLSWNITTDLESGLTEASSTEYFLYLSIDGQRVISDIKPYQRQDLKGYYHPYHTWRCVGVAFNDSSSNLVCLSVIPYNSEVFSSSVVLKDAKPSGSNGGSSTGSVFVTRDLNTVELNEDLVNLDSNQFTLLAGTYDIDGLAYSFRSNGHVAMLYNVTDTTEVFRGTPAASLTGISDSQSASFIAGKFTITEPKVFELRHRVASSRSSDGLGVPNAFGGDEVYAILKVTREVK